MSTDVLTVEPEAMLANAAAIMHDERVGSLPVVDHGRLVGVLTETDMPRHLVGIGPGCGPEGAEIIVSFPWPGAARSPQEEHRAMLIRDIMLTDAVTATLDTRLPELVRLLQRRGFRHVPILDTGKLVGIVSDRDIKQSMVSAALSVDGKKREHLLETLTAGDIMTRRLVTIGPTDGVEEAARLMVLHRVSALPVTDGDRLLGIVTETDILRLFVRALGVLEPSSRVEVVALDPGSRLTELVCTVEDTGSRISSVMTLQAPNGEKELVLRLATMDARPAMQALEMRGYIVKPEGGVRGR